MKKIIFVLLALGLVGVGISNGIDITIPGLNDIFLPRTYQIIFSNGTSTNYQYGKGVLIVTQKEELTSPETISYEIKGKKFSVICNSQIKGYYVNLLFGNVIFGLSNDNENFLKNLDKSRKIEIKGGLYTDCAGNGLLGDAIVGYVGYKEDGQDIMRLYAGYTYDIKTNKVKFEEGFKNSLRYINGVKLVGYIDSTVGGVGLIGVKLAAGDKLSQLDNSLQNISEGIVLMGNGKVEIGGKEFELLDNNIGVLSSVGVKGLASLSMANVNNNNNKEELIQGLTVEENSKVDKQTRRGSVVLNNGLSFGKIKNIVRKRAFQLCRGKWTYINSDVTYTLTDKLSKINCFKNVGSNTVNIIVNYDVSQYGNPVIVGGEGVNVLIKKSMRGKGFVEVYLDGGNLMIDNNIDLLPISDDGVYTLSNEVTSGGLLKGNFIINGLVGGYDGTFSNFKHKLYILGSLGSLNTISKPTQSRIDYVSNLVGIGDPNKISLTSVFNWTCEEDGLGTDGVNCSDPRDKWKFNSLIVLKNYYPSLLLK